MKPAIPRPRAESVNPQHSRRLDVRFEPPKHFTCTIAGHAARVTVRNISLGGLGLWSDTPLPKAGHLELVLSMGRLEVLARGRAVHCQRQADGRWAVGIEFIKGLSTGPNVERLIDAIASSTIRFS